MDLRAPGGAGRALPPDLRGSVQRVRGNPAPTSPRKLVLAATPVRAPTGPRTRPQALAPSFLGISPRSEPPAWVSPNPGVMRVGASGHRVRPGTQPGWRSRKHFFPGRAARAAGSSGKQLHMCSLLALRVIKLKAGRGGGFSLPLNTKTNKQTNAHAKAASG